MERRKCFHLWGRNCDFKADRFQRSGLLRRRNPRSRRKSRNGRNFRLKIFRFLPFNCRFFMIFSLFLSAISQIVSFHNFFFHFPRLQNFHDITILLNFSHFHDFARFSYFSFCEFAPSHEFFKICQQRNNESKVTKPLKIALQIPKIHWIWTN